MANVPFRCGIVAIAIAALGLVAPASLAQTNNPRTVDPNDGFSSPEGEAGLLDSPTGAFDLIHQSVLRNDTSREEFQTRQRDRIGSEAASFREQQQQLIRESQASEPDDEVVE